MCAGRRVGKRLHGSQPRAARNAGGECQVGPVAARLQRARTEYAELSLASLRDCVAQIPFFSEIRMSRIEKLFITK